MMQLLEKENKIAEFIEAAAFINKLDGNVWLRGYVKSMLYFLNKEYQKCIDYLHSSNLLKVCEKQTPLFNTIAAKSYEKIGEYKKSAEYYQKQNDTNKDNRYTFKEYATGIENRSKVILPAPLDDLHSNYFIMTGFPRSGTTLLENALSSHMEIATCEETSSLMKTLKTAYAWPLDQDPEKKNLLLRAQYHQNLYYENLDRYVFNKNATCIIDKTPIISSDIKYMENIFPNKKYIFSIRHPYDVVLSNFKQVFKQNTAMAAFNDMHQTCELYNMVMTNWFEVFPGDTDRVHYVYYHDLVLDFKSQMEKVLSFLGLNWTDEILNFVEHSEKRPVKTPSYTNVRKGLGLGVQSSWENYNFLFDDKCRALLNPWVEKFGYDKVE